jgi:hypothetical protein
MLDRFCAFMCYFKGVSELCWHSMKKMRVPGLKLQRSGYTNQCHVILGHFPAPPDFTSQEVIPMSFDAARPRVAQEPRLQPTQRTNTPAGAGAVNPTPTASQTPAVTPNYNSVLTTSTAGAEAGIEPTQVSFGKNLFKPMDDAFGPILKDFADMLRALDPEKAPSQLEKLGKNISEIAGQIGEKMAQAAQAQPAQSTAAAESPQSQEAAQAAAASAAQAATTAAAQAAADDDTFEVMSFDDEPQVAQQAQSAAQPEAAQQAEAAAEQAQVAQQAQSSTQSEAPQQAQAAQAAEAVQPTPDGSQSEAPSPSRPVSETPIRDSIPEQADTEGVDLKAQFDKQWAAVLENRDARAIAQFLELQIQRLREKAQSLIAPQP